MSTDTLQDFVQARLLAYDPTIDLSDGSPAQDQVVDPIVRRFQPDPFEMSIEDFIDARLKQEIPTMSIQEGTGVRDLLVKPDQVLLEPVIREVQLIKQGQSLSNPDLLADTEADALVANFFVSRNLGSLAVGRVRLFFNAPIAINVSVGNVCYTADGLRFLPTTIQSISAEAMVFNQTGSLYYFDISVTAESPGTQYNIAPQAITGITNLNVAVRATNLTAFTSGLDQETTSDLIQRTSNSITERSLVVPRGVTARLFDQFNDLEQLQIIGMFDPEMHRDVLTGGDLGAALITGNDGYVTDDGLGGTTTTSFMTYLDHNLSTLFSVGPIENTYLLTNEVAFGTDGVIASPNIDRFTSASAAFTTDDVGNLISLRGGSENNGPLKIVSVLSPTTVQLVSPLTGLPYSGVPEISITWMLLRSQRQTQIEALLGPTELKLATPIPVTTNMMSWTIRKKELTISDMPGGIVFSSDAQAVSIQSDQVHIGGCTDFYVRGAGTQTLDLMLSAIEDEEPLITSATGITNAIVDGGYFFQDPSIDFVAAGVKPGMSLVTFLGTDAGTRRIVRVGISNTGASNPNYLQVDTSSVFSTSTGGIQYDVVDKLDIDLINPKTFRDTGLHGQTLQLGQVFTTSDLVDFVAFGTEVGDTLRLLTGPDAGDYSITAISGTGNRDLSLSRSTTATTTELSWQVFKAQTGLQLPLIRIKSISLLDSSGNPTGSIIPKADPVDARSNTFSNSGNGVKLSISDGILGIVGLVDLQTLSYPLAACTLDIQWTDSGSSVSAHVVLTGCTSVDSILQVINTDTPNLAGTFTGDNGERFLTLRSTNRWVRVTATSGVSLGVTLGDDNRQIRHAADLSFLWENPDYDLRPSLDVVYITSGLNIGNYYLVVIDDVNHKIMVTGFDEESGTVRFLQPDMDVELSVGSRSTGTARVYFLDPTSFEVCGAYRPALKSTSECAANSAAVGPSVDGGTIAEDEPPVTHFTTKINGAELGFIPDPALQRTVIPEAGNTVIPNNLTVTTGLSFGYATSEEDPAVAFGAGSRNDVIDFVSRGIQVGDLIQITYQPLQGTVDLGPLTAPTSPLVGKTLVLKVDDKKIPITFSSNIAAPDDVANEINAAVGGTSIAFITSFGSAYYLMLEADVPIIILTTGNAQTMLGFVPPSPFSNESYLHMNDTLGLYKVVSLSNSGSYDPTKGYQIEIIGVDNAPPIAPPTGYYAQAHHFQVLQPGVQRLSSTDMNTQLESGLYYADVKLISDGSGDMWNIPEGLVFIVTGHTSDGYRLVVADSNLSYSTQEQLSLDLTSRILEVGDTDSLENEAQLAGRNIQIEYEQAGIVADIQSFASSDLDRVLTASILVRHLFPTYINFDMHYIGGSSTDVVTADVLSYLDDLTPNEKVVASVIQDKASRRGASSVTSPITLLAIAYDEDRGISVDRSYDSVSKGRLSTFFEGVINIIQDSAS
jgi:Baseplate J-like protein